MSYLITVLFIIFLGHFPPDGTAGYDPTTTDLVSATHTACAIGVLHPDTSCRK